MTLKEIKNHYNFDFKEHLTAGESIEDDHLVTVFKGSEFDLHSVGINKHVPTTTQFMIYEYKNPNNRRIIRLLSCTHTDCKKVFRKWHNFFDHLRIHTAERPYHCPHEGCDHSFTQKANLNKHLVIHQGEKKFFCKHCDRGFFTKFNLNSHMKTHKKATKPKTAEPQAPAKSQDVEKVSSEKLIEKMRMIRENRKLLELATSKITAQ